MSEPGQSGRRYPRRDAARPGRRLGWSDLALAVGVLALVLLAFSSIRVALVRHDLSQRAGGIRDEIAALEDENAMLRKELDWSRSSAGVERLAREQLGWAKPGESAVVAEALATPRATPKPTATPAPPSWRRLWGLLPAR